MNSIGGGKAKQHGGGKAKQLWRFGLVLCCVYCGSLTELVSIQMSL